MLSSKPIGLKWAGVSLFFKARDICPQRTTRRCLGLVLPSAEGEERFAAGANLFWFEEGMWPSQFLNQAKSLPI
ncbi:MAG: hypothetical protein A3I26_02050 [Candidatus Yanofskybacteria bacterium RIFCSPLOWO2_02_FULL_43_10]|nr:MAG: hypothetical protein A2742_02815 [Candidatus Yanofskybacteria bacterium RIFCSPHIGHO2_01_FULL_43_32]OGN11391.1 MAG: hypothetical protein A3C69_01315 [Candidatus Yanofskybacteria bacterium RIFCSPHIGHO2_02_FULL_43_12]OGN17558.1 MAG: hypothetical protein A3E34_03290 [Candidatus Yanofskybacteria bacterium RIFCSPHIGHO2_12_FULL_43_11]OGN25087.1 MAG: hypothetical protein A2923_01770 [Candidatus Yanofskybacteria bacterium RIFCSPLOWO2_01_FULL_43_46]OGN28742.1 MAG: hypothetical protein A3I26_02050